MVRVLQPVAKLQWLFEWDLSTKFKYILQVKTHGHDELTSEVLCQDIESVNLLGCWVLRNTTNNDSFPVVEGFDES